jgi:c-di-GMP-binding flagellar brake protein YcgR
MERLMITQAELEALLETLARDQRVNVGIGDGRHRAWYRAQVVSHDAASGRLVLTCFMDRPTDRPLEPGERVTVTATRMEDELHSAPMDVEYCSGGARSTVELRIAGAWQPEDERRHQIRVQLRIKAPRARRWVGGAWRDLEATVVDLSSRGIGLLVDHAVQLGERLSLVLPLADGEADLRLTVEVRHAKPDPNADGTWRVGGPFRSLTPQDHERVIRFIFAELRARQPL